MILHLAGNIGGDVLGVELPLAAVVIDIHQCRILARLRRSRIGILRVVIRELAIVQTGGQSNRPLGILRNVDPVMRNVRGSGRNQAHVKQAAGLKRIAPVDQISIGIELNRLIEVRAWIHRALAFFGCLPAPENDPARRILALQFKPSFLRVNSTRREEMPNLERSDDHVYAQRGAGRKHAIATIEGRGDLVNIAKKRLTMLLGFFPNREG